MRSLILSLSTLCLFACHADARSNAPAPTLAAGTSAAEASWDVPRGGGWTLRELEQWKRLSDSVTGGGDPRMGGPASELAVANQRCNTQFAGGFVFETFRGRFVPSESEGSSELSRYVGAPLRALRELCLKDALHAETVRRRVQRVEVRWVDGGRSSFTFGNGVLTAFVSPVAATAERGRDAAQFYSAIVTGLPSSL